jgi:type II secretory ATPase GspE/PulE/Tfp pilus assembly ATPase PilB-like protein
MLINEKSRSSYTNTRPPAYIKRTALEYGMQTLRMDGARKVLAGLTTVAEVLRVTQADM